jgi:hypothetical protein
MVAQDTLVGVLIGRNRFGGLSVQEIQEINIP